MQRTQRTQTSQSATPTLKAKVKPRLKVLRVAEGTQEDAEPAAKRRKKEAAPAAAPRLKSTGPAAPSVSGQTVSSEPVSGETVDGVDIRPSGTVISRAPAMPRTRAVARITRRLARSPGSANSATTDKAPAAMPPANPMNSSSLIAHLLR
jgi:hypothetical protein